MNTAEERSNRIVQAAIELFEKQGMGGTTMEEIAQSASVTRRTLYRYFASKEDILRAAAENHSFTVIEKMTREVDDSLPFLDYLTECILYIVYSVPEEPFYRVQSQADVGKGSRYLYFTSPALLERWLQCFLDKYIDALRAREVNPRLELGTIVSWVGRVSFSFLEHPNPGQSRENLKQEINDYFVNALRYDS
ncbi:MAG: TetR/AcrR family transcriptional regulator [Halioglobus sp.]|nr:TetR/AcrR family transcriptional regulator [Halioglobus sp.]